MAKLTIVADTLDAVELIDELKRAEARAETLPRVVRAELASALADLRRGTKSRDWFATPMIGHVITLEPSPRLTALMGNIRVHNGCA
jgi:hypothetical protein